MKRAFDRAFHDLQSDFGDTFRGFDYGLYEKMAPWNASTVIASIGDALDAELKED
jgi:hypothetical protein